MNQRKVNELKFISKQKIIKNSFLYEKFFMQVREFPMKMTIYNELLSLAFPLIENFSSVRRGLLCTGSDIYIVT